MQGIKDFRVDDPAGAEKIEVGDRVRSYDFEHRDDCYIEGEVTDVDYDLGGCLRYVIVADKRLVQGEDQSDSLHTANDRFYPPMNGTENWLGDFTNGVRKV